jgi:nucleotide-binding universal stress UspA family protein
LSVVDDVNKRSWQIARAKYYLKEQGIDARYLKKEGNVPQAILDTATEEKIDLILMGGYSRKPVAEVILGSALDEVLRHTRKPVLICR